MEVDSCVIDGSVLIYRKEEPEDVMNQMEEFDASSDVLASEDDPRLHEAQEMDPNADAYQFLEMLSIH
jgi:hypothetical protein